MRASSVVALLVLCACTLPGDGNPVSVNNLRRLLDLAGVSDDIINKFLPSDLQHLTVAVSRIWLLLLYRGCNFVVVVVVVVCVVCVCV